MSKNWWKAAEVWKPILGYEGLYEVSNEGRIRSLDRIVEQDNNGSKAKTFYKGKILKGRKNGGGYRVVHVSKNGVSRRLSVHREVAKVFCDKPDGCDVVNHIDNNPSNNKAENLEWTTYKGNMQWATKQGRMHYNPENLKKAQQSRARAVIATDKNGNEYYFPSQKIAAETLGMQSVRGHIAACCRKDYGYKTVGGYSWRYA